MGERRSSGVKRYSLALRGALPLLALATLLIGGPTLAAWALLGGPFGWFHLLIGLGVGAALVLLGGLIFGWALGRYLQRRK